MHFFKMEGPWQGWMGSVYDAVVAGGMGDLYDAVVDALLSDVPVGFRILDLGCGSGQVSIRAAQRNPQAFVLGMDLSPGQIARAHSRGFDIPNVCFGVADALCLPLAGDSFDFVVSAAMIKHLPDRRRGVEQMRRVCREGGSVCVIEVDRDLSREAAREFVDRWKWVPPGSHRLLSAYFHRFVAGQGLNREMLAALLRAAGFSSVEVQRVPEQPFVAGIGRK